MDETTSRDQAEGPKRPYAKPQIQEVPLRPDEAVLGGCKTGGTSGPAAHNNCSPLASPCSSQVS